MAGLSEKALALGLASKSATPSETQETKSAFPVTTQKPDFSVEKCRFNTSCESCASQTEHEEQFGDIFWP
jgi:hypothetical protein